MSFSQVLQHIFPPPTFLSMPSVGVDISDTSLKYIHCVPGGHGHSPFSISYFGDVDIQEGSLRRGIVEDPASLIAALSEVRARTGIEMVRVSLPEERAYLFETSIKNNLSDKDIRSQLEFRLEENVPLSPRDALFDYTIIPSTTDVRSEQKVSVTVYAIETIMSYYEACRAAKLMPVSFEVEAQAIARAAIPRNDAGTHLIIDFGKTRTGVGIVYRGVLMYTSTIEIGGADMSRDMQELLGHISESELTQIKNTQGIIPNKDNPDLTKIMKKTIDAIIKEIKVRVEYWHSKNSHEKDRFIESIILCGGSANMKGIQRYVSEAFHTDTYRADVWKNILSVSHEMPPISQRFAYGYATAIGLALGQYQY